MNYGEVSRENSEREMPKLEFRRAATGKLEENLKWLSVLQKFSKRVNASFRYMTNMSHKTTREMWLTSCAERVLHTEACETRPARVNVNSRQEFDTERFSPN